MHSSAFFRTLTDRRFLAANMVACASLVLLLVFPRETEAERVILELFCYLILPLAFIRLVLRESIFDFGFSWGSRSFFFNTALVALAFLLFGIVLWGLFVIFSGEFPASVPKTIHSDFWEFIAYTILSLFSTGLSVLFFQGFVLFLWKERVRFWSIALVTAIFFLFLFVKNDFAFHLAFLIFIPWSILISAVSFFSNSAIVALCFLMVSDILAIVSTLVFL